jgi:uncharacterized protein YkwD
MKFIAFVIFSTIAFCLLFPDRAITLSEQSDTDSKNNITILLIDDTPYPEEEEKIPYPEIEVDDLDNIYYRSEVITEGIVDVEKFTTYLNDYRASMGAEPLVYDTTLEQVAYLQAIDNYTKHHALNVADAVRKGKSTEEVMKVRRHAHLNTNPQYHTLGDRFDVFGIDGYLGENCISIEDQNMNKFVTNRNREYNANNPQRPYRYVDNLERMLLQCYINSKPHNETQLSTKYTRYAMITLTGVCDRTGDEKLYNVIVFQGGT